MGWEMYKLACEFSKALNMHTLDSTDDSITHSSPSADFDRMGMWELMHLDLFYRLMHDKPATISASVNKWRVNLPTLSADLHYDAHASIPTVSFMVRSRVTFILFRYFQLLDYHHEQQDMTGSIEQLCTEISDINHEWQIVGHVLSNLSQTFQADMNQDSWVEEVKNDDIKSWILIKLSLESDAAILFMLRKAKSLSTGAEFPLFQGYSVPTSDLAVGAARRNLVRVQQMLRVFKFPASETISVLFGTCHVYFAFACIALAVLQETQTVQREQDMDLLEKTAQCIADSSYEADCKPFAKYLQYINLQLRQNKI